MTPIRSFLKRRAARFFAIAGLGLGALTGSGCAVVALGAIVGTVAFAEGELSAPVAAGIYETVDATKEAARRLQLEPTAQVGDASMARMTAVDAYGNRVVIKLIPETTEVTRVNIRVNAFGDEAYSRRVLGEIQRSLRR